MPPVPQQAFRGVRRTRASGEIIGQLRDLMASGRLKPGDRLPPERVFAQLLDVGRSTVREAIRSLESLGLVEVRAGQGTFLTAPEAIGQGDPLITSLFEGSDAQAKMFEVRKVVEPGLAGLAARRAAPDQMANMRAALLKQATRIQRGEAGIAEAATFHSWVSQAAGNDVLTRIMQNLIQLLERAQGDSRWRSGSAARLLEEEWTILHAIEGRNPLLAERQMRAHLHTIERLTPSLKGSDPRPHPSSA